MGQFSLDNSRRMYHEVVQGDCGEITLTQDDLGKFYTLPQDARESLIKALQIFCNSVHLTVDVGHEAVVRRKHVVSNVPHLVFFASNRTNVHELLAIKNLGLRPD